MTKRLIEFYDSIANQISKVGFKDQLWIYSDDFSLEIELISHQK